MSVRIPRPKPSRLLLTLGFTAVFALLTGRPADNGAPVSSPSGSAPLLAASLEDEQREGEKLAAKFATWLGPLAPVALSPFFALTCLSGASLLADSDLPFTEGIKKNPILGKNSALHNRFVFAGLLGLTLLTAAPKLTKVTKPLGQAIDQIEAHAGIISIIAVQFLSRIQLDGDTPPAAVIVFQAGIFSLTTDVLIAVFSAINIFVVNTVKFFFEVLIWLSPIPAVDAIFEAVNKAGAALLVALYVWSPWFATMLNLLIFAICLLIFAWIHRRVVYMRSVLGDPIVGWCAENILGRPHATLTSTRLPSAIASQFPQCSLVLKAFAGTAFDGVKRKARGYLVRSSEGRLVFAQSQFLRKPVVVTLSKPGQRTTVEEGLLSNSVVLANAGAGGAVTLIITRRYNLLLDGVRTQLGARADPSIEEAGPAADRVLAASRALGTAAQGTSGRNELRAELA